MSIVNIKKELFKLLSYEKERVYSSTDVNEKATHNIKYNIFNDYYMMVYNNDSFSYVFDLKSKVLEIAKKSEKQYNDLLEKYNREKDKKLIKEINELADKIDAYNSIYNIIKKNLKSKNNNQVEYSNKIIKKLMELNKEKDNSKRNELDSEIYKLKEERRVRLSNESDELIIKQICELESLELTIAEYSSNSKSYEVNRKEFLNHLKNTLHAINEYYFLDCQKSKYYKENPNISKEENDEVFAKRFNMYVNKYYSLISSLFNDTYFMIGKSDNKISSDDLINYLALYNIDGNYELFKSKTKNKLIGNKEINKTDYLKKIEFLNEIINMFLNQCSNKIKNNTITICDNRTSRDELIKARNIKIGEIDNMLEGEKSRARK